MQWRKAAQHSVTAIVKANSFVEKTSKNPPADEVAKFCIDILNSCLGQSSTISVQTIQTNQTTILHTISFMKETICCFSKDHIKISCELALRLIKLNYPLVTSGSLQLLYSLFSSQSVIVTSKLNVQIINALYECQPSSGDVQPTLAWLLVMQQAHIYLSE